MASYDAEIRVGTKIDNSQLEKGTEEIKKELDEVEKKAKEKKVSLKWSEEDKKRAEKEIDELLAKKKKLQESESKSGTTTEEPRVVDFDWEKNAAEMDRVNAEVEAILNGTSEQSQKASQRMNKLRDDLEGCSKSLKELESQGKYFGDSDYDKVYLDWQNARDAVKEYATELNKQSTKGKAAEAEKAAKAAELEAEQQRKIEESAERNLQKENARIEKEAAIQAKLQEQEAAKRRLEELQNGAVVSNQDLVALLNEQKEITERMALLKKAGVGEGYEEYDSLQAKLAQVNGEIKNARTGFSRVEKNGRKAFDSIQKGTRKTNGLLKTMGTRLKGIALSLLIFNWITKGFNALMTSMKEGFQNLAKYSKDYNAQMSALKSSTAQLKNNLAAAFEPIVNMAIPYLVKLINWLNVATETVTQFLSVLSGKSTYTKAKKQVIDYAKSLDTATNSAKRALASFDELNVLNKDTGTVSSSGGEVSGADAFETGTISSDISNFATVIMNALQPFRDAIAAWWSELDFEPLLTSFERLREACEPFAGYLYDGMLWFLDEILLPLGSFIIEDWLPVFFDRLSATLDFLSVIIDGLQPYGEWLWKEFLQPLATWVGKTIIADMEMFTEVLRKFTAWCKADKSHVDLMSAVVLGFLAGIMTYYTTKKIVSAIDTISTALKTFGGISSALISPVGLAALAIGTLVASIILISQNWDKLNGAQKAATVLSGLVAAALAAALAIAVFHTAWSVGIAAAAIVGGLVALGVSTAILSKQSVSSSDGSVGTSFYNSNDFSGSPLPMLADGAVIQGGKPFAAILGDQRTGQTNIESPLSTIEQALQNVYDRNGMTGDIALTVNLDGDVVYKNVVKRDRIYQGASGHSAFVN